MSSEGPTSRARSTYFDRVVRQVESPRTLAISELAQTIEHAELDFKREVGNLRRGKVDNAELAKDAAAMAHAMGGHIVVGAAEHPKHVLSVYKPTGALKFTP